MYLCDLSLPIAFLKHPARSTKLFLTVRMKQLKFQFLFHFMNSTVNLVHFCFPHQPFYMAASRIELATFTCHDPEVAS